MKKIYTLTLFAAFGLFSFSQTPVTVMGGTSLVVNSGTTLSNSSIELKSTSDSYSNLILNGSLGTSDIVSYDRYVNLIGSVSNIGNDLVSLPVRTDGDTFTDLLTYGNNSVNIASNPADMTVYAFGPYDNSLPTPKYVNFDSDENNAITRGRGYRAATADDPIVTANGRTVRFTGTVADMDIPIAVETVNSSFNSVGNPYPSYLDSQLFLDENTNAIAANSTLNPDAAGIYAYHSGTFSGSASIGQNYFIINKLVNTDVNIAPGQGFFISDNSANLNDVSFTLGMRTIIGNDDFIMGRNTNENSMLRIKAETGNKSFGTEIYFTEITSSGLDIGYDATVLSGIVSDFMVYSHLVEDNTGKSMAIQALSNLDLNDVTIPLGLKASQGQQITFSIEKSTLPTGVEVYLEDNETDTFTLLNDSNYVFTAATVLNGTGRFFLRTGNGTLSTIDQNKNSLQIFTANGNLQILGQLMGKTDVLLYDVQGRAVSNHILEVNSTRNDIDVSNLNSGIYIVKLSNDLQQKTQKVIIK